MGIEVSIHGPRRWSAKRITVRLTRSVGVVLVVAATIATVPAAWIAILAGVQVAPGNSEPLKALPPIIGDHLWPIWLISVVAVATWPVGIRFVRYHRRPVLFLRRFGDIDATSVVTDAVWRIGASWRVMTLDDEQVAPVGNNSRATVTSRFVFGFGRWFDLIFHGARRPLRTVSKAAGWGAGLTAAALVIFGHGSLSERLRSLYDTSGFGVHVLQAFLFVLLGCLFVFFAGALAAALMVITLPAWLIVQKAARAVKSTEQYLKTIPVTNDNDIAHVRSLIQKFSRRALMTRLVILKVESSIWQPTVMAVAQECKVALIDISDVTDNIVWEIEQLTELGLSAVYVGEQSRVLHLSRLPDDNDGTGRVRALLDGRTVLAYTNDQPGRRRFVKALQLSFDHQVKQRSRPAAVST